MAAWPRLSIAILFLSLDFHSAVTNAQLAGGIHYLGSLYQSQAISQSTLNQSIHPKSTSYFTMVILGALRLMTAYATYLVLSAVSEPPQDATILLSPVDICCRLQRVLSLLATGSFCIVCINIQDHSFAN